MKQQMQKQSIFEYGREKIGCFYLAIVLIFLSTIANLAAYYFGYKIIILLIAKEADYRPIFQHGFYLLISKAINGILLSFGLHQSHIFAYFSLGEIRRQILHKMAINPLGETLKFSAGYVRQKLVDSVEKLEGLLAHMLPEGIPYVISFFLTFILIFIVDWRMGLLAIIPLLLAFLMMGKMMATGKAKMGPYYESVKNMSGNMTEYIAGIEVIKVFNRKDQQYKKLKDSIDTYKNFTLDWYDISYTPMAIATTLASTFVFAVLPVGTWMLMRGSIELPTLVFTSLLCYSLSLSSIKVLFFSSGYMQLSKRIDDIVSEFLTTELETGDEELTKIESIEFKDVHFAYGEADVIKGISLRVDAGQELALVGESGSGKSTLLKLLMHYYDVRTGAIVINGIDLRKIKLESLMDRIAYVSQDNYLFDLSIRENLRIGKADASEEEIIKACKLAQVHEDILKLESGYDTIVGQSGSKLSGGQKQRICIARALLKDVDVVILDEATAYTDPENEFKINSALAELMRGRILISIAHKLSLIEKADQIALLDQGHLVASGRHAEMLEVPQYRKLWNRFMDAKSFELNVGGSEL
ncbi:MAG: ABC transporter ATP-binding protein [Eubacteriales bacterium]|nr:ABC transporter ATP-binding protein [Eubacteriales bacterium]